MTAPDHRPSVSGKAGIPDAGLPDGVRAMPLRGRSAALRAEPVPVSGLRPAAAIAEAIDETVEDIVSGFGAAGNWISVKDHLPPEPGPPLLVTNNISARDAFGHMDHVWIASMIHKDSGQPGNFYVFSQDSDRKIWGVTHWALILPPKELTRDSGSRAEHRDREDGLDPKGGRAARRRAGIAQPEERP